VEYYFIGEREAAIGFRFVGIPGRAIYGREDTLEAFKRATGQERTSSGSPYPEYGAKVLILTESALSLIEAEVLEWQFEAKYPLIVEIPGLSGHLQGKKTLVEAIREAVGIQV
jgi:vacuolar-type H+-ATPase subunit F/Vma7